MNPFRPRLRRRFMPSLPGAALDRRDLMAASITQVGATVAIIADPLTDNTATATVANGLLDVNVNGADYTFDPAKVGAISFDATRTVASTTQTFANSTSYIGIAVGGAGANHFTAGTNFDVFIGGNGLNTFDAGSGYVIFLGSSAGDNTFNLGSGSGFVMGMGGTSHVNNGTGNYWVF